MRKHIFLTIVILVTVSACGSTGTNTITRSAENGVRMTQSDNQGKVITVAKTLRCKEPVAKISIAPMKCQASQCESLPQATGNLAVFVRMSGESLGPDFSKLGATMSTMLASSLEQTGCFNLLDRAALVELKQEMALAGQAFTPDTADILITGAITSLVHQIRETGIGGSGMTFGLFSNLKTSATLGVDVRLIDVKTSSVKYTKTYRSDTSSNQYAFGLGNTTSGNNRVNAAATFGADLEIEEAVRTVLNKTVYDIIESSAKGKFYEQTVNVNN